VAIERKNTASEFESMLRRHLKSGGAPVAACAGFDFDAASAYLENLLGGPQRARFESHLAGCADCRRHLIGLSRLAQAAPHAGTKPATVAEPSPAWIRWREVAVGWLDYSSGLSLKWQLAGVTGAAFAILIAALGVQSLRQAPERSGIAAANQPSSIQAESANKEPASQPSPDNMSVAMANGRLEDRSSTVSQQGQQGQFGQPKVLATIPPPPTVGPKEAMSNVSVTPSKDSITLSSPLPSAPPAPSIQAFGAERRQGTVMHLDGRVDAVDRLSQQVIADSRESSRAQEQGGASQTEQGKAERDQARNDISARISAPRDINPMQEPKPKPTPAAKRAPSRLYEVAMALLPNSKPEPGRKAAPEPLDEESFKPLATTIRGKSFRFDRDRGMWIDQSYKPERDRWRLKKLMRGSKEYEHVLAADPQLKDFFDRGPILVIWKDTIYKVCDTDSCVASR
jgi:hypothetical protein